MYNVTVFGLGYVGCVSAGCLAKLGHNVIGVDTNSEKAELINSGKPTIVEADISEIIADQQASGRLWATCDCGAALEGSDISLICVGTPSDITGSPDMAAVMKVADQIGAELEKRAASKQVNAHIVAIRSTSPPGTGDAVAAKIVKGRNLTEGKDFCVVANPEFLREGSSVADYFNPQYTLVGSDFNAASEIVSELYADIDAPILVTQRRTAELIKYASNTFHALKVTFANEISAVCKGFDIDSHAVMDLICKDTRLNISPAYLKPGFAFGGSCLPKDLRAINSFATQRGIQIPMLSAVARSNEAHIKRAQKQILATGCKKVGVLGLAFKGGTDDLRESPVVELLEGLLGKGCELKIHDDNVSMTRIMGANRRFIDARFPHLVQHMTESLDELAQGSEIIIATQRSQKYRDFIRRILPTHKVVDLVRLFDVLPDSKNYSGIGW